MTLPLPRAVRGPVVVAGAFAGLLCTFVFGAAWPSGVALAAVGPSAAVRTGVSAPAAPPVPPAARRTTRSGRFGATLDSSVYPGGGLDAFGDATPIADPLAGLQLDAPVVGMAAAPDGGFWFVAADGGVFSVGGAPFYGSMGGQPLYAPVVGMAATPDGGGYWLVAADGGIFSFGDARFYGSMGEKPLYAPVVGMAATPDGGGYWLVAADGGIFSFGDARFSGSLGGDHTLQSGIVAMAVTPAGTGYWLLEWNGAVFPFGSAKAFGAPSGAPAAAPFRAIVATADGAGYWLLEPDAFDYGFARPSPPGGDPAIVNAAASQISPDPDTGLYCNPYGPCEPWCALFATWAWQRGGTAIPSYSFVGSIYQWSADHGRVLPATAQAVAGDDVLYGTGPQNAATAVHVGIVALVWPDHAVVTIEGDSGPGVTGHLAVVVNGPFLPTQSSAYDNYPVFAIAQP